MGLACATGDLGGLLVDLTVGILGLGALSLFATFVLLLVLSRQARAQRDRPLSLSVGRSRARFRSDTTR